MTGIILKIYTYLEKHRTTAFLSFLLLTALLTISVLRLNYKEDIADFLPLDSNHQNALNVYQDIAGANKIFAVFQCKDSTRSNPDTLVEAMESFVSTLTERDSAGMAKELTAQVDMEKITEITDFVYSNMPYFLSESDYQRMDSLLQRPGYIAHLLQQDKQMLMFPSGGLLSDNIQRDPLNLFTPVVEKLQHTDSGLKYETYEGYIFSPDMQRSVIMVNSPFGASETEHNTQLIALLRSVAETTSADFKNTEIHIIGGPVIAVGNATRIKTDSILSVSLAVALILALLFFSFRSWKNLLLIAVSISWGWLFAMGCLAFIHNNVSIIVIGISSVIVGIAVNYPLHFIAHLSHTPDKKKALKEIVMPLVVGNITTVGAFLALVPLQSVAMRDLGLFSSFLLVGTILFVLLFLPHVSTIKKHEENRLFNKIGDVSLENKPVVLTLVMVLTLLFAWYSFDTEFDANIGHINYITEEQKADMANFQKMMTNAGNDQKVYAVSTDSTLNAALDKSQSMQPCYKKLMQQGWVTRHFGLKQFICSEKEQKDRLRLWNDFVARHKDRLRSDIATEGSKQGFTKESFDDFFALFRTDYRVQPISYFSPLTQSVFSSNLSCDSTRHRYSIVDILSVDSCNTEKVENAISRQGGYGFDVQSMNSAIANNLSDNFNYIGWACGCIVFFFLWISFGSIELAILSFIPMAVSWVWILGIMALFGIKFNIVNIILATFIFGQGDDYTIFMTEGASYEYAYRRKMLASYKNSIILSALIMFIGIGTLIFARHPALHSLAEVTIAGMFSVVLMAYIFPPLIFKFLVGSKGAYRKRPISLLPLLVMGLSAFVFFCQLLMVCVKGFLVYRCRKHSVCRDLNFHRYVQRLFGFDLAHIPGVKYRVENPSGESIDKPVLIVSNHQSMLDAAVFLALSPKLVLVSNKQPGNNRVIKRVYKWLGCVTLTDNMDDNLRTLRERVQRGYSLVVFPEGERNPQSSILRFHKGAFYVSQLLGLDILPVFLHGLNDVLPRNSWVVHPGQITVSIQKRILLTDTEWGSDYVERTKRVHKYYVNEYSKLALQQENSHYFHHFLLDRYRYKGTEVYKSVVRNLRKHNDYAEWIDSSRKVSSVVVVNNKYGEFALLYALVHKDVEVYVPESDEDNARLLYHCAENVVSNLQILQKADLPTLKEKNCRAFVFDGEREYNEIFGNIEIVKR